MSTKPSTPGSTTVKVSTNSGAAKDEIFTGINEDNATLNLNVLANDPGSAKLWSLDQNALNAPAGSQQAQNLGASTLASGATISLNSDGTVRYDGTAAMQSLAEGDVFNDSFIYTIRMANGALSTAKATVAIVGVNDAAVFGGVNTGSVQEDGVLGTGGVVTVADVDHDQSAFGAIGNLAGTYGNFTFNSSNGAWTYTLRNADANVQALAGGQSVQDTLQISSLDGTASELVVTIGGADEPARVNQSVKWTVNKQNVTSDAEENGGLQARVENGVVRIIGFDANDKVHPSQLGQDNPFIMQFDNDNDGTADSTLLNFHTQNGPLEHVDVILVGYLGFTVENNLF